MKTYFEFSGDTPAIFLVKKDRSETLVNYRREGDVIVVDKVAAQWTLRNGSQATCVFNLHAVEDPAPATAMTPIVAPDDAALSVDVAAEGNGGCQWPTLISSAKRLCPRKASLGRGLADRPPGWGCFSGVCCRGDGLRLVCPDPSLGSARQHARILQYRADAAKIGVRRGRGGQARQQAGAGAATPAPPPPAPR